MTRRQPMPKPLCFLRRRLSWLELGDHLGSFLERVIGGGHAAIDRLLQDNFLDVVDAEAAFAKGGADVQAELIPLFEGDHAADHENAARAFVVVRPRPDLAPSGTGDEVLKFFVERVFSRIGAVHPGIAQHLATLGHAAFVSLSLVHGIYPSKKSSTRSEEHTS